VSPAVLVRQKVTTILDVVHGDREEEDSHEEVGSRQVLDVEGVRPILLPKEKTARDDECVSHNAEETHYPNTARDIKIALLLLFENTQIS
jgi:hypothetical protein